MFGLHIQLYLNALWLIQLHLNVLQVWICKWPVLEVTDNQCITYTVIAVPRSQQVAEYACEASQSSNSKAIYCFYNMTGINY